MSHSGTSKAWTALALALSALVLRIGVASDARYEPHGKRSQPVPAAAGAASSMAAVSSPLSAKVETAVLTRTGIPGDEFNIAVQPETTFLTTDPLVCVVFSYDGGTATDNGYLQWVSLGGDVHYGAQLMCSTSSWRFEPSAKMPLCVFGMRCSGCSPIIRIAPSSSGS